MRDIIAEQAKLIDTQATINRLQVEIETNATLQNFSLESYAAQKLKFDLNSALDTINLTTLEQERLLKSLFAKFDHGKKPLTSLKEIVALKPTDLPQPNFIFPEKANVQAINEAEFALKYARSILSEHQFAGLPEFNIGASWNTTNKSINLNANFSLPITPEVLELEQSKLFQEALAVELNLETVINTYEQSIAAFQIEIKRYLSFVTEYSREYELTKLKLKEVQALFAAGVSDQLSVSNAEQTVEQVLLKQTLKAIDGLLIDLDITSLSSP